MCHGDLISSLASIFSFHSCSQCPSPNPHFSFPDLCLLSNVFLMINCTLLPRSSSQSITPLSFTLLATNAQWLRGKILHSLAFTYIVALCAQHYSRSYIYSSYQLCKEGKNIIPILQIVLAPFYRIQVLVKEHR